MPRQATKSNSLLTPIVVSAVCGAILLSIANSAAWVNRYIFNSQNFATVATESLLSESSRRAMAQEITNQALEGRPTAQQLVNNTAVNVISGVLGSDQLGNAVEKLVNRLNVALTSKDQESIAINLEGPKTFITQVVDVVGKYREVQVNPENIPSEIVLVNADNIPDFYTYGVVFLWLGPLAFIGSVVVFAYPYFKHRSEYKMIMMVQGLAIVVAGLLALLIGPLFRPPLLARLQSTEARTVVTNLYNAFINTYNQQTMILIGVGGLLLVVSGGLVGYTIIKAKRKH